MKTATETNNFHEVEVSTVTLSNGTIETIIFFNDTELWCTRKVQDIKKQHKIGVKYAENKNLRFGNPFSQAILS